VCAAAAAGDISELERLLAGGYQADPMWDEEAHPNQPFPPSALCVAAGRGHIQMVMRLLSAGADPSWTYGRVGRRPLHDAIDCTTEASSKLLIFALILAGADPAVQSSIDGERTGIVQLPPALVYVKLRQPPSPAIVVAVESAAKRQTRAEKNDAASVALHAKTMAAAAARQETMPALLEQAHVRSVEKVEQALSNRPAPAAMDGQLLPTARYQSSGNCIASLTSPVKPRGSVNWGRGEPKGLADSLDLSKQIILRADSPDF
jgi:hypothetical protein